jgi:methyltransferase (TIGR00027 family)
MRAGHPSLAARWVAAQRLRLERTRPSTPDGDIEAEHRLYRAIAGGVNVPVGRASALAQRTKVIDAEVARALGSGTNQIVLLGAGGDGRALRFAGGATRWFEIDLPQAQADKRGRLDALGIVSAGTRHLALDLLSDDVGAALQAAGHDADAPSLFVSEGVFDALTLEATAATCTALRARAAPGSVLVATFTVEPPASGAVRALRSGAALVRRATADARRNEFRPSDPQKLLVVTGWHVTHSESSAERRLDPGAHMLILVSEPDAARGG